mgnify:FL=1|tara:strand:+ start:1162 stop:1812 length:651 start_codon:yes stop_codon:yes gene_type:complete
MKKLVIFDLDNTLLNGDSDRNWGEFLSEKKIVNSNYLLRSEQFYNNYYQGSLDIDGFLNFCLEPLKNNKMDVLLELREEFIEKKIKPIVLSDALTKVKEEMENSRVIIATATNDFVTKPIADLFGIEDLIATEFEIADNKFTGQVLGLPCFREGKLKKVTEWINLNGYALTQSRFYSDSFNDLPLLKKVKEAVVVDGDEKLLMEAKKNGWLCLSFR